MIFSSFGNVGRRIGKLFVSPTLSSDERKFVKIICISNHAIKFAMGRGVRFAVPSSDILVLEFDLVTVFI